MFPLPDPNLLSHVLILYTENVVPAMVKRREDLEKQLLQLDMEVIREEQCFWRDISRLAKDLRYKLEDYRKEEVREGLL